MDADGKVTVVFDSLTKRTYYVSKDFVGCELDRMMAIENHKALLLENTTFVEQAGEEVVEIFATMMAQSFDNCRLSEDLAKISGCEAEHERDRIYVAINPAKTNWQVVHRQIILIIEDHMDLSGQGIEVEYFKAMSEEI